MLDINRISHVAVFEKDWHKEKLGKFSASKFGLLVSAKSHEGKFTANAMTYIEGLAGEILTGVPAQQEFFTNDTDHGNATEPEAINHTASLLGLNILRNSERGGTNRLIINDEYSGCTPDALLSKYENDKIFDETGGFIKVDPLEVKSPARHHRFIKLFRCNTPEDLKKTESIYYWQVITQMMFCDSLVAYFGCYNPYFPVPGKVITFRKKELMEDVKIFKCTLHFAKLELQKTVEMMKPIHYHKGIN